MDILLDKYGDMIITKQGDILLEESVAQKINIRLRWFEGEWRWDVEEGLPYFEGLFIKNPNTDAFESRIREKIFEVEEVTGIKDVRIIIHSETRGASIHYTALTDNETIREEVRIDGLRSY